jgi:Arc/MetJ-type ribon-helix-helix transcriptional regulator
MSENVNVSARIPPYYLWVVDRLVGRRFKNRSDAVTQMMAAWLASQRDWLENNDLGESDFDRPRSVEHRPRGTVPAAVLPYGPKGEGRAQEKKEKAPKKRGKRSRPSR